MILRRPSFCWYKVALSRAQSTLLNRSLAVRQTIFALATPPGKAGVAVVRVSGPEAKAVWRAMIRRLGKGKGTTNLDDLGGSAKMIRCEVIDHRDGEAVDDGLAVYFKAPHSFTTQPTVELHVHSSPAVLSRVLASLSSIPGLRPAERGEFTRRAFEAGRMDLTQVEALRDLVESETEVQRKWARKGVEGRSREKYDQIRTSLISALASVEALIDFGEGEDLEADVYDQARGRVIRLRDEILHHLSPARRGEIYTSGLRLAIFGPPNAGKSSLLNYLAQREAAIVTPVPGTTRDVLEIALDVGGWRVRVSDTAGLRETKDVVESIGVERAGQAVADADVTLCVLSLPEVLQSGSTSKGSDNTSVRGPDLFEHHMKPDTLLLLNKADLVPSAKDAEALSNATEQLVTRVSRTWTVSVQRGDGMSDFMEDLAGILKQRYEVSEGDEPLVTHARHRAHLEATVAFLNAFLEMGPQDIVLAAEELRYAAQEVGKISGAVDVEDVLDAVFREFCVGK